MVGVVEVVVVVPSHCRGRCSSRVGVVLLAARVLKDKFRHALPWVPWAMGVTVQEVGFRESHVMHNRPESHSLDSEPLNEGD